MHKGTRDDNRPTREPMRPRNAPRRMRVDNSNASE